MLIETRRLYHDDPDLLVFPARVLEVRPGPERTRDVILDRTAFYPTGGGQPHDTGSIGTAPVLEVFEEAGAVIHRVDGNLSPGPVEGRVDADRRRDHRQQHTGQHILSRAALERLGAATVGFHLGPERCTIDLDRPGLRESDLSPAEELANEVIQRDVDIRTACYEDQAEVPSGIRGMISVSGAVRIVSIGDFDDNPCGGTHCRRSAEVGVVRILGTENKKGGTRVEFVCGHRAVRELLAGHRTLQRTAEILSVAGDAVPGRVSGLLDGARDLRLRHESADRELRELWVEREAARRPPGPLWVDLPAGRDSWIPAVAVALAEHRGAPVLLTLPDETGCRIAIATTDETAGKRFADLVRPLGGKGGGSGGVARGWIPEAVRDALRRAWPGEDGP